MHVSGPYRPPSTASSTPRTGACPGETSAPVVKAPSPVADFGAILMKCKIKLSGRWDSNPHCQRPKRCASCQLGYGPFLFFNLPANVGVCEWQFGQRKRRFSFLLSSQSPLMWSTCKTIGMPFHSASMPHASQMHGTPLRTIRREWERHLQAEVLAEAGDVAGGLDV